MNSFFTFLYGLINPLEPAEETEERGGSRRVVDLQDDDEEEEDEHRGRAAKDHGKEGQKIIIVGLQNQ